MQLLAVLLACVLSIAGGDGPSGQTRLTFASESSFQMLVSRTTLGDGLATFHCLSSRSGTCHYRIYIEHCEAAAGQADGACDCRDLDHFELAVGARRQLQGLPAALAECVGSAAGRCA